MMEFILKMDERVLIHLFGSLLFDFTNPSALICLPTYRNASTPQKRQLKPTQLLGSSFNFSVKSIKHLP